MNKAGIYLHIPFCKTKCIYCDFYSITNRDDSINDFVSCISKEINLNKNKLSNYEFDTIFFGGGTPSVLKPDQLESIMYNLNENFKISNNCEITLECNPGEISFDKLVNFRKLGVNRLSIGFQSFNDKHLKFLGRLHNSKDSINTYNNAQKAGFENINIDLIYDIPNQTIEEWKNDLKNITSISPTHISAYSLTVEKNTVLNSMVKNKTIAMPSSSLDKKMFLTTIDYLDKHGYLHYEISNFSKKDLHCKHNLHYWKLNPYLAFGPGAHGYDGETRWWNKRSIDYYLESLKQNISPIQTKEILSSKDNFNELIMNGLRLINGFDYTKNNLLNKDDFKLHLITNSNISYFIFDGNQVRLTDDAILFADKIISDLFII
tara:strand:+ start:4662 stop:5789 length:1128 start_codon:yes stop_codon:yes gene_type:complete